jgi:hypothetical protein
MPVAAVLFVFEVADDHPGFEQTVRVVAVEALLAYPVVERFDISVVPQLSGRNVGHTDLAFAELLQRLRNELRSVVHPQHLRRPADGGEHRFELGDKAFGGDRTLDRMKQRPPRVRRSSTRS